MQVYTTWEENAVVEGGALILKARHETGTQAAQLQQVCESSCNDAACKQQCASVQFSSARLRTAGKFSVGPGSGGFSTIKISARVKVDPGAGLWPALWMLPEDQSLARCSGCGKYGKWARSGEIDIFESSNDMLIAKSTIHYGDFWPNNVEYGGSAPMNPGEWQTISMTWQKKQIQWYLNGRFMQSALSGNGTTNGWFSAGATDPDAPFDSKFHLLVNLAVGGGYTGNIPPEAAAATLSVPKTMHIDWIRVYGRN